MISKGDNVLLSSRYGIPTTNANPTIPIKIIGFLSRLSGSTIYPSHRLAMARPLDQLAYSGFKRTASPRLIKVPRPQYPQFYGPIANQHLFSLLNSSSADSVDLHHAIALDIHAVRGKVVLTACNVEEI